MANNKKNANQINGNRVLKFQKLLAENDIDVAILLPGTNLFYLTNCRPILMERPTMVMFSSNKPPRAFSPEVEADIFQNAGFKDLVIYEDGDDIPAAFEKFFQGYVEMPRRIGVEPLSMRIMEYQYLRKVAPDFTIVSVDPLLSSLRIRKDDSEIEKLIEAGRVADIVFATAQKVIEPGKTEREVRAKLVTVYEEYGTKEYSGNLVSGIRTSSPHGGPTDKIINKNELVRLGFSFKLNDYKADVTRTFVLGEVSDELKEIYQVVYESQAAGIKAARPGLECGELDRICRKVIEDHGYGKYFVHRTGHGLGMDTHEEPYIVQGNKQKLEPGMVITIEPGIYVPNLGGVRIEDDFLITEDGNKALSNYPREWENMLIEV